MNVRCNNTNGLSSRYETALRRTPVTRLEKHCAQDVFYLVCFNARTKLAGGDCLDHRNC
jgi:hypothetical protein